LFCRAVLIALAFAACTKDPVIDQRVVTLYTLEDPPDAITPPSCAVPTSAYAFYEAAGDFELDPNAPPNPGHLLSAINPTLSEIPASTRQLTLEVSVDDTNRWRGYGLIPTTGDIAELLWPAGHECELRPSVDARLGGTITPYDDRHVLIAGGPGQPSFVADLSNGSVTSLTTAQEIGAPRIFATASVVSGAVVIAGGEIGNAPVASAEFFDTQTGAFSGQSMDLIVPRARHGATTLVNGNVLLVGGIGAANGALDPSCELIDPVQRHATEGGVDPLMYARANPTVLLLASGEPLVIGGTDSNGAVGYVEWFSTDGKHNTGHASIAASQHESFVALPAGGALGVISPDDASGVTTTWVITSDRKIQQGASLAAVPPGANIRLFPGANGAPLLWTGTNWFRWSPWTGAFVSFLDATSSDGSTLANGPSVDAVTTSPDSGLALWLENAGVNNGKVIGLRFDSRGPYSTDAETLLSGTTTSIAPDRLPGADLSFEAAIANGPATGLALGANAQAAIADANYLNFSLDFDSGELEMPTLVLRDASGNDFSIGTDLATSCSFIDNANHLHVERNGGVVSISTNAAALSACGNPLPSSDARVTVLFRGPSARSTVQAHVRNVVVKRD
jgi:hypothetical protein